MPDYRRYRVQGGTYFFTVNLLERHANDLMVRHIDSLRSVVRETRKRWPFHIDAWAVLPEHLHCVWTLSVGDDDNANRRVIKQGFFKSLPITERRSAVRVARGERGIWQGFRVLLTPLTYIHVGSVAFGSMRFGMMRIMPRMSIIATSTALSMAWSSRLLIGLIQPFTVMWSRGFIH
jgi:REP element-mobilizing transposase RayT